MATIRVDFDQVMLFGDLHRDVSQSLEGYRSAFGLDGRHLDRIIDEFDLTRSTSNTHFAGHTIAYSLDNASDRAHRVADSLMATSSRIFRQAAPVDDSFDWSGALWSTIGQIALGPGMAALDLVGGEIIGHVAGAVAKGSMTAGMVVLAPIYLVVSGGLAIYEGFEQFQESMADYWGGVAGTLKMVAGSIGVAVGIVGAGFLLVGAGTAAAFFAVPAVAIALGVGAVLGAAALVIDHRHTIAEALGFGGTSIEAEGNLLTGGGPTIPLGPSRGPTIVKEFTISGTEATTAAGLLQGGTGRLQGPGVSSPQPEAATPRSPRATQPSGPRVDASFDESGASLKSRFQQDWRPTYHDQWNMRYNASGNCTSYVAWRLNDLAQQAGLDWSMDNNHIGDAGGLKLSDAEHWGPRAENAGFPPDDRPTAGSVAWWPVGGVSDNYGHVGIVREVRPDGTILVEESSWDVSVFEIKEYRPGDDNYPAGFIHMLPGT